MRVAVLGAGNGGIAAAADLTLRGHEVRLGSRSSQRLAAIHEQGGIRIEGAAGEGVAMPALVTTDFEAAIHDADVVMLVVPATAHQAYGQRLATCLRPGQTVFLNPGGTGGGLNFVQAMRRAGYRHEIRSCEVATLSYGCRVVGPAHVEVQMVTKNLPFAAFPGVHGAQLLPAIRELYPAIRSAASVLETGFANLNAIEHPPQTLLNAGWLEHTAGDFYFYAEGTTPAIARVIEAIDRERIAVAASLAVATLRFLDRFADVGYATPDAIASGNVADAVRGNPLTRWIKGPMSLDHRYVHEDVGYGLVPMVALASLRGVPTPAMDALITLANVISSRNYRSEGLTLDRMGLADIGVDTLDDYLWTGAR